MKRLRSVLASALCVSMALLAPGGNAWSQVAQVSVGASPVSAGVSAAPVAGVQNLGAGLSPAALIPILAAPSAPLGAASLAPIDRAGAAVLPAAAVRPYQGRADFIPMWSESAAPTARGQIQSAAAPLARPDVDAAAHLGGVFDSALKAPALGDAAAIVAAAPAGASSPLARSTPHFAAPAPYSSMTSPLERVFPPARGRSGLVPLAAAAAFTMSAAFGFSFVQPLLTLSLLLISIVLHEIGHAKAAKALGDPTATDLGRASFNPLSWYKHVDPFLSVVLPVVTSLTAGFFLGGAKPVPVDASRFKNPSRGMAMVALAGPAVNLSLAALGALAFAGAAAAGLGPVVLGALTTFVFINAFLAIFNLMPIPPFDGGHVLLWALPVRVASAVRGFYYGKWGLLGFVPIVIIAAFGGGALIAGAAAWLTAYLLAASLAVTSVPVTSAVLPAMAALGMAIGSLTNSSGIPQLKAAGDDASIPAASSEESLGRPVDLVVMFSPDHLVTQDYHLTWADRGAGDYVQAYEGLQSGLLAEMSAVGLSPETLASYGASPIASYRRINAATIRVDASKAEEFEAALIDAGHRVYSNDVHARAGLDDILKSLTSAANDGNTVILNSWGLDGVDPDGPASTLVKTLESEGHVLVAETGTIRVVAAPSSDPVKAAARVLEAFVRANPGVEYASAGFWGRAWMRLTGRGPKD